MKHLHISLSLFLMVFLSSCCQNVNTTCNPGNLGIYVTGFRDSELRASPASFIPPYAIRYHQDNAFDDPIDTLMISHYNNGGDTFFLSFNLSQTGATAAFDSFENGLVLGYDYKIVFPADTLTYLLTGIDAAKNNKMELQKCGDKSPPRCYKNAISCSINGVSTLTWSNVGSRVAVAIFIPTPQPLFIYRSKNLQSHTKVVW